MSVIDKIHQDRYDTPKTPFALDIEDLSNFEYDMQHCIKCKGCYWVDHTYMPGMENAVRCPSNLWKEFDSYGAFGKMRIGLHMLKGEVEWNDHLLELIYADPLCGACDVGCKRNLDLETGLTLEALRVKAVQDGAGPMPGQKKVIQKIKNSGNIYGSSAPRNGWITEDIQVSEQAETVYFPGCLSSFQRKELAQSTARLLNTAKVGFMLLPEESCCGNIAFSAGDIETARDIAEKNVEQMRNTGAKTLVVSCAECYRMWKVDYPKLLNIRTADLGFEVKHIIEMAHDTWKEGKLELRNPVNLQITYHDSCGVSRLCDDWEPYEGERGWMGTIEPGLTRRRGRQGLYQMTRELLENIPGLELKEMQRTRENSLCCAGGRGTAFDFPELSEFSASERLREAESTGAEVLVTACPWCISNFNSVKAEEDPFEIADIAQILLKAAVQEGDIA